MSAEVKILEKRAESYRDYPIELKASVIAAIEANGGNVLATSKLFNLPRDTVNYWWNHAERFVEVKHASSQSLADQCEGIARNLAESISGHDLSIVPLHHKASAFGVIVDRMQLLRGQPTSITVDLERTELTVILQSSLSAGLEAIDIESEPVFHG